MDLEYCTVCEFLTEIAVRGGGQRICYDCVDATE
jgi:hypothetical protein